MIIGNGDIAKVVREVDRDNLLFFASGVSNSQEKDEAAYKREIDLLEKTAKKYGNKYRVVYFSSFIIFTQDTRYSRHKRLMENLVKSYFDKWTIFRLGNITWGNNPHTFINYLLAHPEAKIKDEYRYICNQNDLKYWIGLIPNWNIEMNIPGLRMKIKDIIDNYKEMENY